MKKLLKWFVIVGGGLMVLTILVLLVVPMFVDVQKFKPTIEAKVAQATGRTFEMGDIRLSLFPWAGLTLSKVKMGNPPGFTGTEFATVGDFEVKVKLLPLLFKDIQVKHLNLEGLELVLERQKNGEVNWTFPVAESAPDTAASPEESTIPDSAGGLPLKKLDVGQVSISNSRVQWIDHLQDTRKDVADISLMVKDVSLEKPLRIEAFARLDGNPVSIDGAVGPLGPVPGQGTIPFDLQISAFKQLDITIGGKITDPMTTPTYETRIQTAEFAPRVVMDALGQAFPIETSDKEALRKVSFQAGVSGDDTRVSVTDGVIKLDQSTLKFKVNVADFSKPDVAFSFHLDRIDLDRYLPAADTDEKIPAAEAPPAKSGPAAKPDYTPVRKLVLDGDLRVDQLKAGGASVKDLLLKVSGKKGRFLLNPLSMALYNGTLTATGAWDFQKDTPKSKIELMAQNIQAGSLLADVLEKDLLSGTAAASATLDMRGDSPDMIKKTLNGSGHLVFKDGAIKGIDLTAMVQNITAAFGDSSREEEAVPETPFTEFQAPFTIQSGVVNTERTILVSPVLQVMANGKADLTREKINFRVEPTLVNPMKGAAGLTGVTVPVLVSGTFQSPAFRPDVSGLVEKKVQEFLPKLLESKKTKTGEDATQPETESLEDSVKGLLKDLPFGR